MTKYFNFNGVAKRQEYWAVIVLSILAIIVGSVALLDLSGLGTLVALAIFVATIWAILATTVRRLRDAGLSIWWILTLFIPYVSFVAQIVFGVVGTVEHKEQ